MSSKSYQSCEYIWQTVGLILILIIKTMHNDFTYGHSELPPVRSEIKAEIVALDAQLANLILKSQGNYRELQELAEMLDNCLDSCELNLNAIRISADDSPELPVVTMTDLSVQEKTIIFGTALFSAMALETLSRLTGADAAVLAAKISEQVDLKMDEISDEQITASLKDFFEKYRETPTQPIFRIKVQTD